MEAKYYTPKTEDFHKGFEFQWFQNDWEKDTFAITTDDDLEIIDDEIREGKIRVKCLDREDIESLGWNVKSFEINMFHYRDFYLKVVDNNKIYIFNGLEGDLHYSCLFVGYLKNKSELKRIMVQTGIIEN